MDKKITNIINSFLKKNYVYTVVFNITKNECNLIQYSKEFAPLSPLKTDYDVLLSEMNNYVHPMYLQEYQEIFSRQNLLKAADNNEDIQFEFLHFLQKDGQYHWITAHLTGVSDGSGDVIFIYTATCSDKQKEEAEKRNEELFNRTVKDLLIQDYILVYIVELSSSMSRLAHSRHGDFYYKYADKFDSHIEMMQHLYERYVEPEFKEEFAKFIDYDYIIDQFGKGKDRLFFIFRDNRKITFELSVFKCPDYADDYPLAVYAIKEIV